MRGKEVFLDRCVGCHGLAGDGKGPGARFLSPPPADFTDKDDACCGGDTGPGDFYYRILRGWTGTAMENFGDRLSVDDIWRVVLFLKTIPNHTLEHEPHPRAEGLHRLAALEGAAGLGEVATAADRQRGLRRRELVTDPFMQEAMRRLPGPRPERPAVAQRQATHAALARRLPPQASRRIYQDMLDRAWSDAASSRREAARPRRRRRSRRGAGPAMRRLALGASRSSAVSALVPAGGSRSRTTSRRRSSRAG